MYSENIKLLLFSKESISWKKTCTFLQPRMD